MEKSNLETPRKPGRPKGYPKTGGRKKGSINKSTIILPAIIEGAGFDIGKEIRDLYKMADTDQKIRILTELMKYFPALAPVDSNELLKNTDPDPNPVTEVSEETLLAMVE